MTRRWRQMAPITTRTHKSQMGRRAQSVILLAAALSRNFRYGTVAGLAALNGGATPGRDGVRPAAVLDLVDAGKRAWSMARGQVEGDRRVAERELVAVLRFDVPLLSLIHI